MHLWSLYPGYELAHLKFKLAVRDPAVPGLPERHQLPLRCLSPG